MKEWIAMFLGLGLGICNPASSRFDPLSEQGVNGANVRVFRSDEGVTSASSATRWRTGVLSTDVLGGEVLDPVDGAGMIRLNSGRVLHIGGAPLGDGATSVNTIRASDDGGKTWDVIAAGEAGPSYTRFKPGHSLGICQDSTYGYVIGGDPIIGGNGEVWRTPLSGDGTTWTLAATHAWLASRIGFWLGVLPDDTIVIGGGQTDINDPATALASYYELTNSGATSTLIGNAPFAARGFIAGPLPVLNIGGTDELLLVGGGRYDDGAGNVYYDDVWSYDGTTWTERLATGHGQFTANRYNTVVVLNGRAWMFTGSINGDADTAAVYTATVPGTWTASSLTFAHGDSHARAAIAIDDAILYDNGFQTNDLFVIREHTGALVSSWVDQGVGGLSLLQATDGSKPILDLDAFSSGPGVVLTRGQIMTLASADVAIANGILEVYVIGKSLNFDTNSTQGLNAPCTIVGNQGGSTWNNFGLNAGLVNYRSAAPTTVTTADDGAANDDNVHVIGFQHLSSGGGTHNLYLDGTLKKTATGGTFSVDYNGWDSVGGGYLGDDKAEYVVKMIVIVRDHTSATGSAFRSGLQRLAY